MFDAQCWEDNSAQVPAHSGATQAIPHDLGCSVFGSGSWVGFGWVGMGVGGTFALPKQDKSENKSQEMS